MKQSCSLSAWMSVSAFTISTESTALSRLRVSVEQLRGATFSIQEHFLAHLFDRYGVDHLDSKIKIMFAGGRQREGGCLLRSLYLSGIVPQNIAWGERLWIQARLSTDEVFASEEAACAILRYGTRFDRWGDHRHPTCFYFHGALRTSERVRVVSGEAARLLGLIGPTDSSAEPSDPKEFARIGDHIGLCLREDAEKRQHRVEVVYV